MSSEQAAKQIRDVFQNSRNWAILRCSEIMIDSGRKDLAKQILLTMRIDRKRLKELKTQIHKENY